MRGLSIRRCRGVVRGAVPESAGLSRRRTRRLPHADGGEACDAGYAKMVPKARIRAVGVRRGCPGLLRTAGRASGRRSCEAGGRCRRVGVDGLRSEDSFAVSGFGQRIRPVAGRACVRRGLPDPERDRCEEVVRDGCSLPDGVGEPRVTPRKNGGRRNAEPPFVSLRMPAELTCVRFGEVSVQLHEETRDEPLSVYQPVFPAVAPPAPQPEERACREPSGKRACETGVEYVFPYAFLQPGGRARKREPSPLRARGGRSRWRSGSAGTGACAVAAPSVRAAASRSAHGARRRTAPSR